MLRFSLKNYHGFLQILAAGSRRGRCPPWPGGLTSTSSLYLSSADADDLFDAYSTMPCMSTTSMYAVLLRGQGNGIVFLAVIFLLHMFISAVFSFQGK
jgi:hypothetical protein